MNSSRGRGVRYTEEFKLNAIKLVLEKGMTISAAAGELGVSRIQLKRWADGNIKGISLHSNKIELKNAHEKIEQLELENKRLRFERNILKKAAALLVNEE